MHHVINRFIHHAKHEKGLSKTTLAGYRDDLRKFADFLRENYGRQLLPGDVTPEMINRFLQFLGEHGYRRRNSAPSRAKRLASIRSFFRYLHREGLIGRDPANEVHAPRLKFTEPDYLHPNEYKALLLATEQNRNPFLALRDKALLATFLGTGARVSELIRMDLGNLQLDARRIKLERKGGDSQSLPISQELVAILQPYLKERRRKAHCRSVFISIRGHRLTQQSVWTIVHQCALRARLSKSRISPHTLRHTFATTLLANGENLQTIRVLMNHKNLSTTARYLHSKDQQLIAAVETISLDAGDLE